MTYISKVQFQPIYSLEKEYTVEDLESIWEKYVAQCEKDEVNQILQWYDVNEYSVKYVERMANLPEGEKMTHPLKGWFEFAAPIKANLGGGLNVTDSALFIGIGGAMTGWLANLDTGIHPVNRSYVRSFPKPEIKHILNLTALFELIEEQGDVMKLKVVKKEDCSLFVTRFYVVVL